MALRTSYSERAASEDWEVAQRLRTKEGIRQYFPRLEDYVVRYRLGYVLRKVRVVILIFEKKGMGPVVCVIYDEHSYASWICVIRLSMSNHVV